MRKSHSIFDSFQFTYKSNLLFDLEKNHQPFDLYLLPACDCPQFKIIYQLFKKSCLHTFLISTLVDYVINHVIHHVTNHVTSYLSKQAEHPPPSRPLVVDQLTCFYNSKSSHNGSASPFGRQGRSALFFVVSALCSALRSTLRSPLCLLPDVEDLP